MDFPIVAHPDKFGIKVFGAGSLSPALFRNLS